MKIEGKSFVPVFSREAESVVRLSIELVCKTLQIHKKPDKKMG